jgi:hypothetical protein
MNPSQFERLLYFTSEIVWNFDVYDRLTTELNDRRDDLSYSVGMRVPNPWMSDPGSWNESTKPPDE